MFSESNLVKLDKPRRRKWLPLRQYPRYSVSADGLVRSGTNPILLRNFPDGTPFVLVNANGSRQEMPVDVLVAFAWLGMPPGDGYRVLHLDGDTKNCDAGNLTWAPDPDYWFDFYKQLMAVPSWYTPGLKLAHI